MKEMIKNVLIEFLELDLANYDIGATIDDIDLDQLSDALVDGLYDNFGDLFERADELIEEE